MHVSSKIVKENLNKVGTTFSRLQLASLHFSGADPRDLLVHGLASFPVATLGLERAETETQGLEGDGFVGSENEGPHYQP